MNGILQNDNKIAVKIFLFTHHLASDFLPAPQLTSLRKNTILVLVRVTTMQTR